MIESPRELAIARSVAYAALFDYPLTLPQLRQTLIESTQSESEILATYAASEALRGAIGYREGFFFPQGREDLMPERRRREAASRAFLRRHRLALTLICALPTVRMVALSGSIAHLNLTPGGDLDLFIVTRGRSVWSTTVAVIVLARLLRRRRTICANYVMADGRLAVAPRDLFTANQLLHLRPIVGAEVYRELLDANPFVRQCYPNADGAGARLVESPGRERLHRVMAACEPLLRLPLAAAETICRIAYGRYLRRRAASWQSPDQVRLEPDCLKLHTRSHRHSVLERLDAAVQELQTPKAAPMPSETSRGLRTA